ncbi:MAG: hypothetical protein B7Y70_05995 [Rhizobiales bacterium 35-68-8]|nr:MAG: hypothetical protein B7Y70_05995 [Rhizobiales bacterium 35-68-8]
MNATSHNCVNARQVMPAHAWEARIVQFRGIALSRVASAFRHFGDRHGGAGCTQSGRHPALAGLGALLLLALILLALAPPAWAEAPEPLVIGTQDGVSLSGHIAALEDRTGTLNLDDIRGMEAAFRPLKGDFSAGYTSAAWWLRVRVVPTDGAAGTWYLALNAPYTDHIEIFAPDAGPDGTPEPAHKRTGAFRPLAERDLITNTYTVRVAFAEGMPEDIYIRLSGTRSLNAKPMLWRLPAFLKHQTLHVLLISIAMGAALVTSIGSLIFGIWLRNRQFIWYGVYVGATALVFFSNAGFLPLVLDMLAPRIVLRIQGVVSCLSIMTGAFMIRSIFCPPGRLKRLGQVFFAYGVLAGLSVPVAAAGYYGLVAPVLMAGVLIVPLLVPVVAALQLRGGGPAAIWYFVGFSSYSIATFWFAVVVFGLAPPTNLMEWGHQSIGLLHMFAIFGGLAAALQASARERRALQGRLLQAYQRNAAELEQAVAHRTAALEAEIAARQEAEAALHVAMREQRNFLVMVSHEFRTPLSTIRAAIALIERGSQDMGERLRNEAGKIVRAVARLGSLIDTFLTDELIQSATMKMDTTPVDFAALTASLSREMAAETGRTISVSGAPSALVEGDPVLLRSVVENLVGNAIKHSSGPVAVTVNESADAIVLQVADRGPGIAPDEQDLIFERYYRSPGASSRPGAGIGLHVARRVSEMHRGVIRVFSTPGNGSTFEVRLPRLKDDAALAFFSSPASGA